MTEAEAWWRCMAYANPAYAKVLEATAARAETGELTEADLSAGAELLRRVTEPANVYQTAVNNVLAREFRAANIDGLTYRAIWLEIVRLDPEAARS